MKREKLQADGYDGQKIADVSREYYSCIERARAIFDGQMDELRSHVRKIMAVNAGVLAAIWLLMFVGVPVGRWGRGCASCVGVTPLSLKRNAAVPLQGDRRGFWYSERDVRHALCAPICCSRPPTTKHCDTPQSTTLPWSLVSTMRRHVCNAPSGPTWTPGGRT